MVLLVTPDEKARITTGAAQLGVSASEYVRKLVAAIDAEDLAELENIAALMPVFAAAVDNIEANVSRTAERFEAAERQRAYRATEEYRAKVREEVLADPSINWDAVRALFGGAGDEQDAA